MLNEQVWRNINCDVCCTTKQNIIYNMKDKAKYLRSLGYYVTSKALYPAGHYYFRT